MQQSLAAPPSVCASPTRGRVSTHVHKKSALPAKHALCRHTNVSTRKVINALAACTAALHQRVRQEHASACNHKMPARHPTAPSHAPSLWTQRQQARLLTAPPAAAAVQPAPWAAVANARGTVRGWHRACADALLHAFTACCSTCRPCPHELQWKPPWAAPPAPAGRMMARTRGRQSHARRKESAAACARRRHSQRCSSRRSRASNTRQTHQNPSRSQLSQQRGPSMHRTFCRMAITSVISGRLS